MRRANPQTTEIVNSDSFLDIVASIVSIMIIMVVMEGSRIKNAPVKVSIPMNQEMVELEKDLAAEQQMRADVLKIAEEIRNIQQVTLARAVERDALATMVAAAERAVEEHRKRLDGARQTDFDLARNLSEARFELEQLTRQREDAARAESEPVVIESYPTPISRVVDGPETHFMITNGRIVHIPLEQLLEEFQSQAKRQLYKLMDQSELTDTVGPIAGFRLRYTLQRHDISPESMKETGRSGSYARLEKWTLIPMSNDLGEPIDQALSQGSEFRRELSKILPGRTTITIWVYPEGFEALRKLRKELYKMQHSVAVRPLPPGVPISGSPEGSKSAAQ